MKRILWALAIIIILAFILLEVGGVPKKDFPYKYIGAIEGRKIPVEDFVKSIEEVRVTLFLNYFNQPEVLRDLRENRVFLNRLAWENLIIKEKARKDKILVSDEEIVSFVTGHPLFSRGGVFDDKLYNYILINSLGMLPRAFEENTRGALINAKYREGIVKDTAVSDEELRQTYKKDFEKAKFYYVVIDKNDYLDEVKPAEEEIDAYYEQNKNRFKEPEKVVLQYIAFPHKEPGIKEKTLQDLNAAFKKLAENPPDMESIAENLELTVEETAPFSQDEIVPEIGGTKDISAALSKLRPLLDIMPVLDENEIGASYIIRVKEKISERIKTRNEVRDSIIDALKEEKAMHLAREKAEHTHEIGAEENLSLEKRLQKEAWKEKQKKGKIHLRQTELIARSDYVEGVGEARKLVDEAFNLKAGEVSGPIEIRKGFALIEPIAFELMDEDGFQKEKQNYEIRALSAKRAKAFEDWLNEAQAQTSLYVDLDKI